MSLTPEEKELVRNRANAFVERLNIRRAVSWLFVLIPALELAYLYLKSS